MKTAIIIGTRPEIIKMSPVIKALQGKEFVFIHTNQHYSTELDEIFFRELELPRPDYNLGVGSGSHATQTGTAMMRIEEVLKAEMPNLVLVLGDTNTTLAASIAARKLQIKLGHIEAGLRSNNMGMPEELNRRMVDHISDYLFAPTRYAQRNLLQEKVRGRVILTGNTIVDVLRKTVGIRGMKSYQKPEDYFIVTLHRAENVDNRERLERWLRAIKRVKREMKFFIHPRTEKMVAQFGLKIETKKPAGYFDFIECLRKARFVLTDSGSIQEEACILHVPCITLRNETERPETIMAGSNILATPSNLLKQIELMLQTGRRWLNPFGRGNAAKKIVRKIYGRN